MRKKLLVSIAAGVLCLCAGVGTLAGTLTVKNNNDNGVVTTATTTTQPKDTSKYWGDAGTGYDTDWAGSGTERDPYLITSAAELAGLSYRIYNDSVKYSEEKIVNGDASYYYGNKYFRQTCDIDVSDYWWTPIGVEQDRNSTQVKRYFSGNYDGIGHKISGVFIEKGLYVGTFGYVKKCPSFSVTPVIKRLGIENSYIKFSEYGGGISGYVYEYMISQCYNAASIEGMLGCAGGIAGKIELSDIDNCYNTGKIDIMSYVGGIIGETASASIRNCYNVAEIGEFSEYGGGIVGNNKWCSLRNCYNLGNIRGIDNKSTGQLIGGNIGSSCSNCYIVSGNAIGVDEGTNNVTITSDLPEKAKTQSFYTTSSNWDVSYPWDFDNVWEINESVNNGYPSFKKVNWSMFADTEWEGDGLTEATAYRIDTPAKLAGIAKQVKAGETFSGKYFKQTADLSLSGYAWSPIGENTTICFSGTYDGAGFKISELYVNSKGNAGLFGYLVNATVKNINIKNSTMLVNGAGSTSWASALASSASGTRIENCNVSATVKGGAYTAGLVANAFSGTVITGSSFTGYIEGTGNVGGICSFTWSGVTIEKCITSATINGGGAGGITSYIASGATVRNCAATGQIIKNDSDVAGIVVTNNGTLENCSFIGGSYTSNVAPVCKNNNGTITSCFAYMGDAQGYYTDGDFSGWALCGQMNDGLPVQTALYYVAQFGDSVDAAWFTAQGFEKV